MRLLKFKYLPYIFLFLLSLSVNLIFLNREIAPKYFPDSYTYLTVADDIGSGRLPDFSVRTPVYPVLLAVFSRTDNLMPLIYFQIFSGALATVVFYWIILQIIPQSYKPFVISLVIMSDYAVINYQGAVLTEGIAVFTLLFCLAVNIYSVTRRLAHINIFLVVIADILLMFLKPSFILLPLIVKIFYLLSVKLNIIFRNKLKTLSLLLIMDTFLLLSFMAYNRIQSGRWQISVVSRINGLGQVLKYGYLNADRVYKDAPQAVQKYILLYSKTPNSDPYQFLPELKIKPPRVLIDEIEILNRYVLGKNRFDLGLKSLLLMPVNFIAHRDFYVPLNKSLSASWWFRAVDRIYDLINYLKLAGVIFAVGQLVYLLKNGDRRAAVLGALLITGIFVVLVNTFYGYAEYPRLRQPVDPVISLFVWMPVVLFGGNIIKRLGFKKRGFKFRFGFRPQGRPGLKKSGRPI